MRGVTTTIKGHLRKGLYVQNGLATVYNVTSVVVIPLNDSQLWHLRLVHISHKGLDKLS